MGCNQSHSLQEYLVTVYMTQGIHHRRVHVIWGRHHTLYVRPMLQEKKHFLNPRGHLVWRKVIWLTMLPPLLYTHIPYSTHTQRTEKTACKGRRQQYTTKCLSLLISKSVSTTLVSYNNSAGELSGFTRHIYNWVNGSICRPKLDLTYYLCVNMCACVSVFLLYFSPCMRISACVPACVVPLPPH